MAQTSIEEKFLAQLAAIAEKYEADPEQGHSYADRELVALLRELGFETLVRAYDALRPKWYA